LDENGRRIPGLNNTGLKLDGETLARIYAGRVTMWDAPRIAAMNPGVKLPHHQIVPIRRADGSGDTFIFTQFLDFANQDWEDGIGYGTTINWPDVPGELSATGNDGMVQTAAKTPFSIAYIGVSFHNAITKAGLGTAMLKNQEGKFLLPTPDTIVEAASNLDQRTPADERLSLVYALGDNSYPLINYEYVVVTTNQPNAATAAALRQFLLWAVSPPGGNAPKYLEAVGFVPLPDFIRALSERQINRIQ
jgi:phosphate transport system substrate-binding protein